MVNTETTDAAVLAAVAALRAGAMVVLVDDPDRENEGDVIAAAEYATAELVNFMASEAKGLICMPMSAERTQQLDLPQMVTDNTDSHRTAFTVSIDHVETGTGISAFERALTAQKAVAEDTRPEDFKKPGHMFPLEAKPGGVLQRSGHTEATVDLLKLAGLREVGLCCEIIDDDGSMMTGSRLRHFARQHQMPLLRVADVVAYMQARTGPGQSCG